MGAPQINPAWSCRGKVYNDVKPEITNGIFVSDSYVKKETIDWLRQNIKKYKFVGVEAKIVKRRLIASENVLLQETEMDSLIHDFFMLLINNPFCTETGIAITEKTYIIGKYLHCYFVQYKNDFMMPLGALERFVHEQVYLLQDEFVNTAREHALNIFNDSSQLIQQVETRTKIPSYVRVATPMRAVFSIVIFVCSLLHVIYCACNIEWKNIKFIFLRAANIFQGLNFVAENGFGINHNDRMLSILMILGLLWVVFLLFYARKLFREVKHAWNYSKFHAVAKEIQQLKRYFPKVEDDINDGIHFIRSNREKSGDIFVATNNYEKRFGPRIQKVEENKAVQFSDKMRKAMPATFLLCVFLFLAIGTSVLRYKSKDEEFIIASRDSFREIQYKFQNFKLKGQDGYFITTEADLYAKDEENALAIYHVNPGTKCTILDWDSSELFFRVSFLTEYGKLKGWIKKDVVAVYNPYSDGTVERIVPIECTVSTEVVEGGYFGAGNLLDNNLTTSWHEGDYGNGYGEWIQLKYDSQKPIRTIGIFNGNGMDESSYCAYARPTEIKITFYQSDVEVERMTYNLSSARFTMQYFDLNKDVYADRVQIEFTEIESGDMYDDMCIAEIEVFGVKVNAE